MHKTRSSATAALALCLVLLVGACGDDDDSVSSEDRDAIIAAIERSATSGDPDACVDAQTQRFTEQTTGQTGKNAIEQCKEDVDDQADKVKVSNIEVDGDSASADVALTGGFFDGQEFAVGLVKRNDGWKPDMLKGFVGDFDREAFYAAFKKEVGSQKGVPAGTADCVEKNVAKLSEAQIDELFIESNRKIENQVFEPCFGE